MQFAQDALSQKKRLNGTSIMPGWSFWHVTCAMLPHALLSEASLILEIF